MGSAIDKKMRWLSGPNATQSDIHANEHVSSKPRLGSIDVIASSASGSRVSASQGAERTLMQSRSPYQHSGYLLATYLLSRGHRKFLFFAADGQRPEDFERYEGFVNALTDATLPANSLFMRMIPQDLDGLQPQVGELLNRIDRPTGIICPSERLVKAVKSCAQSIGFDPHKDLEIVFDNQSLREKREQKYAGAKPPQASHEMAQTVRGILRRILRRKSPQDMRIMVPIKLSPNGPNDT
jgi:DNA-binding LacI/PurR family transcriptional regulator